MSGCACSGGGVTLGCFCAGVAVGSGVGATLSIGVASTAVFCVLLAELLAPPKLPASHNSTSVGLGATHCVPHHSKPSISACTSTAAMAEGLCRVLAGVVVRLKYMGYSSLSSVWLNDRQSRLLRGLALFEQQADALNLRRFERIHHAHHIAVGHGFIRRQNHGLWFVV